VCGGVEVLGAAVMPVTVLYLFGGVEVGGAGAGRWLSTAMGAVTAVSMCAGVPVPYQVGVVTHLGWV
jgi:hypothetical protein